MGCIVYWQFSFYVVLSVLYWNGLGWRYPVSVDAYSEERKLKPGFLVSTTNTTTSNNNDEDSLEEQLKDDQIALKRMVTILSLVGVIGAMAIVAIIVIFTKMRRRKHRINSKTNNALEDTDQQATTGTQQRNRNSNDTNSHCTLDIIRNRSVGDETPTQGDVSILEMSIHPQLRSSDPRVPQPSAPPPPTPPLATTLDRTLLSISLLQQSSPTPSAPTAKELDQQGQYCRSDPTSSTNTTTISTPELPPPAYTPSASPLYDRTYTNTTTQSPSLRRHSRN